jgi:hypothetical protein
MAGYCSGEKFSVRRKAGHGLEIIISSPDTSGIAFFSLLWHNGKTPGRKRPLRPNKREGM